MQEERINQQGYLATNNHNGTTEIEQVHFSNSVVQQPQVPPVRQLDLTQSIVLLSLLQR